MVGWVGSVAGTLVEPCAQHAGSVGGEGEPMLDREHLWWVTSVPGVIIFKSIDPAQLEQVSQPS